MGLFPLKTVFIGGGPNHIDMSPKTRENLEKQIERNIITGKPKYKGVPKEYQASFHNFAEQKAEEAKQSKGKKS